MNSSNVFTNLFHEFFHEFFSVWAVEQENKLLIGSKQVFFLSLPVEKEIITDLEIIDSEFEIGETIWSVY